MYVAINQKGQLVNLLEQKGLKTETYSCPACRAAVRLKAGKIMRSHFAHISLKECKYSSENESVQHLSLKSELYQWLIGQEEVVLEHYMAYSGQIADLFVNGHLALEVQCSSLSLAELKKRTEAYYKADYQVIWLLGRDLWVKDRLTQLQKQVMQFSYNMGFYIWELDDRQKCLRLRYMIHEDWHGKVQCLSREFPFGRGNILSILRLPYTKQAMPFFQAEMDSNLLAYIAQQLYYRVPKWMSLQEHAYKQGKNLLNQNLTDFYPQVRLPSSAIGFAQIRQDLNLVYQSFWHFYDQQVDKKNQILYPPAHYCQK